MFYDTKINSFSLFGKTNLFFLLCYFVSLLKEGPNFVLIFFFNYYFIFVISILAHCVHLFISLSLHIHYFLQNINMHIRIYIRDEKYMAAKLDWAL